MKVRIYSASFGSGHHQANEALGDALQARDPRVRARHTDYLTHLSGFERGVILGFYLGWLRYAPGIYRWYYRFTDRPSEPQLIKDGYRWLGRGSMQRELLQDVPDLAVSSYPTPAAVTGWVRDQYRLKYLNVLVVTDYRIHEHWVRQEADLVLVPTEEARGQMIARGIPEGRVRVTGIPINARYAALIGTATDPGARAALRQRHGLDPQLPLLLVSGGGQGTYRSLNVLLGELGMLGRPVQVLVLAGAKRPGRTQLGGATIHWLGFTTDFPELLAASDLVVGKAGGLTVAEATTLGVPMVIYDPIPGQEEHNAEYLERGGAAVWARTLTTLRPALLRALDPDERARMSAGAFALSVPDAADRAARVILEATAQRAQATAGTQATADTQATRPTDPAPSRDTD